MPDLLWIDDDGPHRFPYEASLCADAGWQITWAASLEAGAKVLSRRPFDALIIDIMLPYSDAKTPPGEASGDAREPWGAYLLLAWLSGLDPQAWALDNQGRSDEFWLGELNASAEHVTANRALLTEKRLAIWSGFKHETVFAGLRAVAPGVSVWPKPIDEDQLVAWLDKVDPR